MTERTPGQGKYSVTSVN